MNPTTTGAKAHKRRGISYTPLTSLSGQLVCWTTHIKDHAFNVDGKVMTYRLSKTEFLQTIPTDKIGGSSISSEEELDRQALTFAEQEAGILIILSIIYNR
jgi:hypothetical protein